MMIISVLIVISLALSAFFSAMETVVISVNPIQLKEKAAAGSKRAAQALRILDSKQKSISTLLIGNNIALVVLSSLTTSLFVRHFGEHGPQLATVVIAPIVLFFGEIIPKAAALSNGMMLILNLGWLLQFFQWIFHPVTRVSTALSRQMFSRTSGTDPYRPVTREDIHSLLEQPVDGNDQLAFELKTIQRLLDFSSKKVSSAMVPLVDVVMIPVETSLESVCEISRRSGFSRMPVYEGGREKIIGILSVIDVLKSSAGKPLKELARRPVFVPEYQEIADSLQTLWDTSDMAVAVDEYGVPTGIITTEDLIEEIMGDIRDEYDRIDRETQHAALTRETMIVSGTMSVSDFNDRVADRIPRGPYDTEGGCVLDQAQRIPEPGEKLQIQGMEVTILEVLNRRILKILIRIKENEAI